MSQSGQDLMDELQEINQFYESDVGKKLVTANASLNEDMQRIVQVFEANLRSEFFATVRANLKEAGFDQPFKGLPVGEVPSDWLDALPGKVLTALHISIETGATPEREGADLAGLFDNNSIEQWQAEGSVEITERALKRAKKLLSEYQEPTLDEAKNEELLAYIARREREIPAADALNQDY